MYVVEWDDHNARVMLTRLVALASDQRSLMQEIGEYMVETTKQRFDTSTAPDGSRWAPNTRTTIERFLGLYKRSFDGKTGKITQQGAGRAAGKKPLVGETGRLRDSTHYRAGKDQVDIVNPTKYAAVHQFGAEQGAFGRNRRNVPLPWGNIPKRPFIGMSSTDEAWLHQRLSSALLAAAAASP